MKRKGIIFLIVILVVIVIALFIVKNKYFPAIPKYESETGEGPRDWRNIQITDVLTGETYIISEINKPILLESFAVWCPTCLKQQKEIKKLHDEIGDSFISISLDTDPNEDEFQVIDHLNKYGFDWIFAISPIEMTQSLMGEFGLKVVNAPIAPVVLVCPGGNARLLERGVKSSLELKSEIETC